MSEQFRLEKLLARVNEEKSNYNTGNSLKRQKAKDELEKIYQNSGYFSAEYQAAVILGIPESEITAKLKENPERLVIEDLKYAYKNCHIKEARLLLGNIGYCKVRVWFDELRRKKS
jgi:hypothetical protein